MADNRNMILSRDIHPEKQLYYVGSLVLDALQNASSSKLSYFELFLAVRKKHNLPVRMFTLALDWLFLLGAIHYNNGEITYLDNTYHDL